MLNTFTMRLPCRMPPPFHIILFCDILFVRRCNITVVYDLPKVGARVRLPSSAFFFLNKNIKIRQNIKIALISSFFANYERTLLADFQFAQMDLARIRVLRTFINSIAKNLHKL